MLKKYQVLIPDWLEDYIKYLAKRYDLNFSEIIRAEVCYAIICHVSQFFPEYKPGMSPEEVLGMLVPEPKEELGKERNQRILSKIYFETRKAIEYRLSQEAGVPEKKK